jgi:hypothetical protein
MQLASLDWIILYKQVILGQTKNTKNEYTLSFETEGVTDTQDFSNGPTQTDA